jgi:hypothetical protein
MNFLGAAPALLFANAGGTGLFDGGSPFVTWAVQFLVTLALEVPMVLAAWRFRGCQGALRVWLLACVIGNLISHPTATWLGGLAGLPSRGLDAFASYTVLETGVIAVEAWAFRIRATTSWTEAVVMSFAANAVTAVLGAYIIFVA